jgi:hypothetical protein
MLSAGDVRPKGEAVMAISVESIREQTAELPAGFVRLPARRERAMR